MKKILLLILIFLFSYLFAMAGNYDDNVPAGMQNLKNQGTKLLVPENTQVRQGGGSTTVEGFKENLARRMANAEVNISSLFEESRAMENEIAQLKKALDEERSANKELKNQIQLLKKDLEKKSKSILDI
jgi:septation ring formation regulator EzrA